MKLFLDTSALVKAYIEEPGSDGVSELLGQATAVIVCVLAEAEAASMLNRLRREGRLRSESYQQIKKDLAQDLGTFDIVEIDRHVLDQAVLLLERFTLRAADALHIAAALHAGADRFVSSDAAQQAAARAAGLQVVDPART